MLGLKAPATSPGFIWYFICWVMKWVNEWVKRKPTERNHDGLYRTVLVVVESGQIETYFGERVNRLCYTVDRQSIRNRTRDNAQVFVWSKKKVGESLSLIQLAFTVGQSLSRARGWVQMLSCICYVLFEVFGRFIDYTEETIQCFKQSYDTLIRNCFTMCLGDQCIYSFAPWFRQGYWRGLENPWGSRKQALSKLLGPFTVLLPSPSQCMVCNRVP